MIIKKIFKVFIWFVLAFIVLIIAVFVYIYFNQDKIKSILLQELNASLTTEIKVQHIDVSLFHTFPDVSLTFNNVLAYDAFKDTGKAKTDTLFSFQRLYLSFNVLDVLKSNYNVNKITAENGQFNMKILKNGDVNYIFWKESEKETNTNFNLSLKTIALNNVSYTYRNNITHQFYNILLKKCSANGKFYASEQNIKLKAQSIVQLIQSDNLVIANKLPVTLNIHCKNNTDNNKIELEPSDISTGKMKFALSGYLNYGENSFIDLSLSGKDISLKHLMSLLPKKFNIFKDYESTGQIVFSSKIKGKIDKFNSPSINASFNINNGSLTNKKLSVSLSQIKLSGKLCNGKDKSIPNISIDNFSASFCNGKIKGSFKLTDFSKLNIEAFLNADLELDKLQQVLQIQNIKTINGNIKCNIEAKGNLNNIDNFTKDILFKGDADVKNLNLVLKDVDYSLSKTNINFELNNKNINVLSLTGLLDNNPVEFSGVVTNPFDCFSINGNMKLKAFNGEIAGNIGFIPSEKKGFNILGSLNMTNVEAKPSFNYFNNFGQTAITDKNIKGKITAKTTFNIAFDEKFNLQKENLTAEIAYKIENGGLQNIPVMQKLSHFVEETALQNVTFATLTSNIHIRKGCISFESLKVNSNALNFEFVGKHYLSSDNIDYHFAIQLSELASKKKKAKLEKQQQNFGTFEEDKDSRLTLFVKVNGTIDNPKFSYDMKRNIEQIKQTITADKQKISTQIKQDFKINSEQTIKDKEQWKKQSNGEWIIEWEDSPKDTGKTKQTQEEAPDLIIEFN
ncbi:MAG: AsmA-like C-terminal region-containing protein [Bacteroidales bacterium]|nr:AsmA-like C-terminal region-containing protein [Bacteroidales bacterium]